MPFAATTMEPGIIIACEARKKETNSMYLSLTHEI